jgi:hypothetical protein
MIFAGLETNSTRKFRSSWPAKLAHRLASSSLGVSGSLLLATACSQSRPPSQIYAVGSSWISPGTSRRRGWDCRSGRVGLQTSIIGHRVKAAEVPASHASRKVFFFFPPLFFLSSWSRHRNSLQLWLVQMRKFSYCASCVLCCLLLGAAAAQPPSTMPRSSPVSTVFSGLGELAQNHMVGAKQHRHSPFDLLHTHCPVPFTTS